MQTLAAGVSTTQTHRTITAWNALVVFTSHFALDPFFQIFHNKISVLQVLFRRYFSIEISKRTILSRLDWLKIMFRVWLVAQAFLTLWVKDPCHPLTGIVQRLLAAWNQTNPHTLQVKPIPIQVLKIIGFVAANLQINLDFSRQPLTWS